MVIFSRSLPIYPYAALDNSKTKGIDRFAEVFLAKCNLGQTISKSRARDGLDLRG